VSKNRQGCQNSDIDRVSVYRLLFSKILKGGSLMVKYIERQEITALLDEARKKNPHLQPILAIMALAGLRVSEATHLPLDAVYYSGNVLTSILLTPTITKKRGFREIPIPQQLTDILQAYLFHRLTINKGSNLLFPSKTGAPFTERSIRHALDKLALATLGKHVSPHMLRHSYATILARVAPIRVVQEALGHRRLSSTQIYTHVNRQDMKRAIDVAFQPQEVSHESNR
jgi:integrase/recombinase XerC